MRFAVRLLLFALLAAGQTPAELEERGDRRLYDYEFAEADEAFRLLGERFPESPSGPYARAATVWSRIAQRNGSMRGSTHRGDRFWTQPRKPEVAPEEEARFRAGTEEALRRVERLLQRDPDDTEALYYRGAIRGLQSGWAMVVERSYFRAFRTGLGAVGDHRKVLALDPEFWDSYAVVGAYDYSLATLPGVLRMIAFVTGRGGDRERGLEYLRITAEKGTRARWGAMLSEAVILQREGMEQDALGRVRTLRREFPRNPDFALEEVALVNLLGSHREARALAERFLEDQRAGFGNFHLAAPGLGRLRLGETFLFEERWAEAEAAFAGALAENPPPELEAMVRLRRGNARDGAGKHGQAGADYIRVRRSGVDDVLAEWADALRRVPWPRGAPPELLPVADQAPPASPE